MGGVPGLDMNPTIDQVVHYLGQLCSPSMYPQLTAATCTVKSPRSVSGGRNKGRGTPAEKIRIRLSTVY